MVMIVRSKWRNCRQGGGKVRDALTQVQGKCSFAGRKMTVHDVLHPFKVRNYTGASIILL
jgi:hypothetical protein